MNYSEDGEEREERMELGNRFAGCLVGGSVFSIAYCLTHTQLDHHAYLETLASVARPYDAELAQRLLSLLEWLDWTEETALKELPKHRRVTGSPIGDIILTAMYAFLKYPDDYARCVLFCVNAGWDTNTKVRNVRPSSNRRTKWGRGTRLGRG